ncbi:DNA glycosylase/AP lyase ROS1-like [Rutidosis leptorrhynchoides]|uniref:DNA glycosylase/AP lyase ROS1-like n=1 Tax=Rutidosis leptorrhynchoides TaxID=125765 RepID=UPI003A98EE3A
MESVNLMERDSVWIPQTPGKSITTTYQATLLYEQGTGKESINKPFPCIDFLGTIKFAGDGECVINKLPSGFFDNEHEAVLHVAEDDDPKPTKAVQYDTSSVQVEEVKVKVSLSEPVHESQAGVDSIPAPSKPNYSRKRRNKDIDLNQKPSQRRRMKKHRPKIYDDSKPKKVPKAQTTKHSTPKPKTPKPKTPNRVQERKKSSTETKFTVSTSYGHVDVTETVQEASKDSIIDVKPCKRFLNFDHVDHGNFDYNRKIVTNKRSNTPRRSRFLKNSLEASEGLLELSNWQQNGEDIYVSKNQEQAGKKCDHVYQRRKKLKVKATNHTLKMLVYQRKVKENSCLQSSKKVGPNFPKIFKKNRTLRKKVCIWKDARFEIPVEDTQSYVRRSVRQCVQTAKENIQNWVSESVDNKGVVEKRTQKRNLVIKGRRLRKNRSVRYTRARIINGSRIHESVPNDNETYLLCDESFLPITECLPLNEATVHTIDTSPVHQTDDSVGNVDCSQLYEVDVLESQSQSLVPRLEHVPLYEVEVLESQSQSQSQSQSLVPRLEHVPCTKDDYIKVYVEGSINNLIKKIASLDINGPCKELVERYPSVANIDIDGQFKELIVRDQNVNGAVVKVGPTKKRKEIPKVNLDKESLRVWKLLMENDGSEPVEETDKDKEEWWEKQREIFRGRVDSFIAKMHLIQGDRRFSPWKGSVTDSVVGVYLTQNVTDHLSSSAFMSVAARFPAKSRTKEIVDRGEDAFRQELDTSSCVDASGVTPIMEPNQDSVSNPSPVACSQESTATGLCTINNPCADVSDATPFVDPNKDSVSVPTLAACSQESVSSNNLVIDCLVKNNEMEHADVSNTTPILAHDKPNVNGNSDNFRERIELEEVDFLKQFCKSDASESQVIREGQSSESVNSVSLPDLNDVVSEIPSESVGQRKSTLEEEPEVANPLYDLLSEVILEQEVNAVHINDHQRLKKKTLETGSSGKKNKSEKKQEKKVDWEEVRKRYCKTGDVETDENYMDAVDWDAVRRATVEELANIIVKRGMNNVLAGKIKDFLDRMYKDHGTHDLEWLRDVPPDMAKEFLLSIEGIGLKSVECIRLLTLHHHAFPVDTNVGRVATRLGWVPLQPLPDAVQIHLLNAYPMVDTIQKYLYPRLITLDQRTLYELHYQLITFGKVFCTKIKPNCDACPMRAECRHYASAVASGRLALPGSEETSNVTSIVSVENEQNHSKFVTPTSHFDIQGGNSGSSYHDPIIEVPSSPEPEIKDTQPIIGDIEDLFIDSDDEIPFIQLNVEEFRETLKDTIETHNIPNLSEDDKTKALVALIAETNTFRVPRMKFVARSRTFHLVHELPDSHPILAGFHEREDDDPSPYLLRVWHPDELPKPLENTENTACNSYNGDQEETYKGTILIPCRTANRGKFPLNGTYFQVNEVFADDETSRFPIDVPSHLLHNLTTRTLGCGSSATSIFRGLSTGVIQRLFWRGSICVRSFNRKTRQPNGLHKRLYMSSTKSVVAANNGKS